MMQAHRYIVRGRVQGVGFRWFVEREANSLGITGWVRNNEDSTVEVLAMGSPEQLSALRRLLERGPRAARVDVVEVSVVEDAQQMSTFQIQGAW